jgi:hypothetical protein
MSSFAERFSTPMNFSLPQPEVTMTAYCTVNRWREVRESHIFFLECPTWPLAFQHWKLDYIIASAWATKRSQPVLAFFSDSV